MFKTIKAGQRCIFKSGKLELIFRKSYIHVYIHGACGNNLLFKKIYNREKMDITGKVMLDFYLLVTVILCRFKI